MLLGNLLHLFSSYTSLSVGWQCMIQFLYLGVAVDIVFSSCQLNWIKLFVIWPLETVMHWMSLDLIFSYIALKVECVAIVSH